MNKNLNLVKILKDCPKGTKLYAILFGGVKFEYIKYNKIFVTDKRGFTRVFTQNGAWDCTHANANECLLLPSKNQRDWSKFNIEPKFNISTLQPFDKVLVRDINMQMWKCDFYDSYMKELNTPFRTINSWYKQCIPYNDETMHLANTNKIPPKKYINWEE